MTPANPVRRALLAAFGTLALALPFGGARAAIVEGPSVTVTPHQVTLTWKTDVDSTTEVHWGPASTADENGYPNHSVSGLAGTTHSRTLPHLAPGTWFFRVKSVDGGASPSVSAEGTFTVSTGDASPLGTLVLNGDVFASARSGNRLFFGGSFSEVGTRRGHGVAVDGTSGLAAEDRPMVAGGAVYSVAPDGNGGFYIGGLFSYVGGLRRNGAAHLLADGGVDPDWDPDLNGYVTAIDVAGSTVYLGGAFTTAGGLPRNGAASADAVTGAVTGWNPDLNSAPYAVKAVGSTVYLGGAFTTANGGTARSFAAAVDASTGLLTAWDPRPNDTVFAMAVSGSTIYLGGYFSSINGTTVRSRAAAVDASGSALGWDPNLDAVPYAIAVSGTTVYLGGAFQTVNGATPRNRAAAVDATTGTALGWDPNLDGQVNSLFVSGSTVYVGGSFTTAKGGTARRRAASFEATSGALGAWDPAPNASIRAVGATGATVFLGGDLTSTGAGTVRNRAAAIDLTTGALDPWHPDLNGDVAAMSVAGSTVYLGGAFTTINAGAATRNRAAAVDATTAVATTWDPNLNNRVDAIALSGSTVYLGGRFTRVNGTVTVRNYLAAVDATSATATSFNPNVYSGNAQGGVRALALSASTLFVGGLFDHVGGGAGTVRQCGAAFELATGNLTAWNPSFNTTGLTDRVEALAIDGALVYAGGYFTLAGGGTHPYAVALSATTGAATTWNPAVNNEVRSIAVSGGLVFLGGHFGTVRGIPQSGVAAVSAATGGRANWNPGLDGYGPRTIQVDCTSGTLVLGGLFAGVGSVPQRGLAVFDAFTCPPANDPPVALDLAFSTVEDQATAVTLAGTDPNGDSLSFAVLSGPTKGSLTGTGANRTYTPNPDANGTDTFTYEVSDGAVTSSPATVTIDIAPVADAPVLQPVGSRAATVGALLAFTVAATDVDGEVPTFAATGLPAGATLDPATGAFAWTPDPGQLGDHLITFIASDGLLDDTESITVTVTSPAADTPADPGGCGCSVPGGGGGAVLPLLLLAGLVRRPRRGCDRGAGAG